MPEIYQPEEDSFLLSSCIKKLRISKNSRALDMGSGSGIQAKTFLEKNISPENISLVDKNKKAISHLKKQFPNSKVIPSDLFKNVKGKFDLIVFNPPYLPLNKDEPKSSQLATTGGKKGSEVINKFLSQSKKHLNKEGKILLLTSNLTKDINWNNYKKKLLAKKKIFFEELYVWELIK